MIRYLILDASAVLFDPFILTDKLNIPSVMDDFVFILTTYMLGEMDEFKIKNKGARENGLVFYDQLRQIRGNNKFEKGVSIDSQNKILLLLDKIQVCPEFSWIGDGADKYLLSLALQLNRKGNQATILTRDAMMGVLAHEYNLDHIFIKYIGQPTPLLPHNSTGIPIISGVI